MGEVRAHVGWDGQFTTDQAEGAYPNGTRVRKVNADSGDQTRNGAIGTVLGSITGRGMLGYFIEWDAMPRAAFFLASHRIRRQTLEERAVHIWPRGTPLRGRV
jgi:hypothetical protein